MKKLRLFIAKGLKIILNPPALRNCSISKKGKVCSRSELTNVELGDYSYIGNNCFMVDVSVGKYCSIADRCCIGGVTHTIERISTSPVFQKGKNVLNTNFAFFDRPKDMITIIENDVWIGMGAYIKGGVTIHNGAVIGMGSVVTHDVPAYEIWAGNPARKIRDRFTKDVSERIEESKWWLWDEARIKEISSTFEKPAELLNWIDNLRKIEDGNID